jgi:hypothetical protein
MKDNILLYIILAINVIILILLLTKKSSETYQPGQHSSFYRLDKAYQSTYNPTTSEIIGGILYSDEDNKPEN